MEEDEEVDEEVEAGMGEEAEEEMEWDKADRDVAV